LAAEKGHTETVKTLLEKGADVNSVDKEVRRIHEEIYYIKDLPLIFVF